MIHIVYCDNTGKKGERELDRIQSKEKSMVIRGAAGRKIPHSRVFEGDELYFMEKGSGVIKVKAVVDHVENFVKLQEEEITQYVDQHQSRLQLSDKQRQRWHKKCLCFVGFHKIEEIQPLTFAHQGNMDDWLIVEKIEDVLEGTSIPYTYDLAKFK